MPRAWNVRRIVPAVAAITFGVVSCGTDEVASTTDVPPLDLASFDIEGHRGARGLKPENTLPAFETALDIGVTTLEFDLHFSADEEVVVWHDAALTPDKCRPVNDADPTVELPAGGAPITSLTVEQLSDYMCDLNPDPSRFPDQNNEPTELGGDRYEPATLGAVFEFVEAYTQSSDKTDAQRAGAAAVQFNIETKRDLRDPSSIGDDFDGVNPGRFELAVLAAITEADVADRVVVQSFDHRSLWAIRSIDSDIRLATLTAAERPDLDEYSARGASIWSPNYLVLTRELVEQAHAVGLLVIPWTVNDRQDMLDVIDLGADGLITDRPDIAISN